jgi:hypothetical protein
VQRRAVGIDLGSRTTWFVVAERSPTGWRVADGGCLDAGEDDRLRSVCRGATVAVDAPPAPSEGLHAGDDRVAAKFRAARCSEVGLRLAGHAVPWVTPAAGATMPAWMTAGFAVWSAASSAAHEVLEVFPHAVFAELAGHRLPRKQTTEGRRARLRALAREVSLPAGADLWGHDAIDAAGAAVVAAHRIDGVARPAACGWHDHQPMWLPAVSGGGRGAPG